MAKTQSGGKPQQDDATSAKSAAAADTIAKKLILTGADIVTIGPEAEILVGGKNYNTALISQISGIRAPQFRAVSSQAFHRVLDETKVNAAGANPLATPCNARTTNNSDGLETKPIIA